MRYSTHRSGRVLKGTKELEAGGVGAKWTIEVFGTKHRNVGPVSKGVKSDLNRTAVGRSDIQCHVLFPLRSELADGKDPCRHRLGFESFLDLQIELMFGHISSRPQDVPSRAL